MRTIPTDKETPTKLRIDNEGWICCPRCDDTFYLHNEFNNRNRYCGRCGQAIDWSNIHPQHHNTKVEDIK